MSKQTNTKIKSILMYETNWCSDCFRALHFFEEHNLKPTRIDIEVETEFIPLVEKINNGRRTVPTIIVTFEDGRKEILVEPSWEELEATFIV